MVNITVPLIMLGSVFGVAINNFLPDIAVGICLIMVLIYSLYKLIKKYFN